MLNSDSTTFWQHYYLLKSLQMKHLTLDAEYQQKTTMAVMLDWLKTEITTISQTSLLVAATSAARTGETLTGFIVGPASSSDRLLCRATAAADDQCPSSATFSAGNTHADNVMERRNRLSERKVIGGRSEQRAPFILVVLSAVWRAGGRAIVRRGRLTMTDRLPSLSEFNSARRPGGRRRTTFDERQFPTYAAPCAF